ncbi:MAG: hypothetical protein HGA86_01330 [Anaerolineaceae bacterium]|nr:hypothetical protein [Anaerolineaceae bacterium]
MFKSDRFYIIRAWLVHFYTSLGLLTSLGAFYYILNGNIKGMFAMIGIAMVIDSTDGTMARAFNVKKWTPDFSGRKLDDITDYINYAFIPLFFVIQQKMVPDGWGQVAVAFCILVAAYGFCRDAAKTDDGYFTGFPNFWNLAVFYLFIFQTSPVLNVFILLFLAANMWVPVKYVSFSTPYFRKLSAILLIPFSVLLTVIGSQIPNSSPVLSYLSLFYPIYYVGISLYLTLKKKPGLSAEVEEMDEREESEDLTPLSEMI